MSLTLFPESELYEDMVNGNYIVSPEHERLEELITFVGNLENKTTLLANTVSNPIPMNGYLPKDKNRLVTELRKIKENISETELNTYRQGIRSL